VQVLTGTRRLTRLAFRRDRIIVPITMLGTVLMVGASAPALVETYSSQEEIYSYVSSSAPSVVARVLQGAIQGPTIGSVLKAEVFLFGLVLLAVMSIFIVSRHTRHNEETGAGELIGSGVVGRSAPLTAALLAAVIANLITGLLIFVILAYIPEFDTVGSAYMSAALVTFGILMACVSAVTVQLSDYRRGANLMAISVLGVFFLIRGLGDALGDLSADGLSVATSWITWISPMGWSFQVLPFADNRITPIIMTLVLSAILTVVAYFLMNMRDIGSSIFASKPGPARAKPGLLSSFGLASRLQRGNLIAWSVGFAVSGILMAVIVDDFRKTFEENELFSEWLSALGSGTFMESIIAAMFPLLAAMLSGYVVAALAKMQDEESSGRIEYLLGTSLSKVKWLFSHVGYTIMGILITLGLMGAAGAIAYTTSAEVKEIASMDIFYASIFNIPAMALFMAIIVLVYSLRGSYLRVFAWSFYAYCAFIGSISGIFSWPSWTSFLSPFTHTPAFPSDSIEWFPIVVMGYLTVALLFAATIIFARRDISLK